MNSATMSICGAYRYRLTREFIGNGPLVAVVMVNPSTADAETNDATIRKLLGLGRRRGWGFLTVCNLFAYRATDVRELERVEDPIGPQNDFFVEEAVIASDFVLAAWGPLAKQPARYRGRADVVLRMAADANKPVLSWGPLAQDGQPKHPLMLSYDLPLQVYRAA